MATGTYAPYARHQLFDSNGNPLASGTLETYAAGLTTPLATYSDATLLTANPTTITLNSAGVPQVSGTEVALFLTPGLSYKFIGKNSAGSVQFTRDSIAAVPFAAGDVDVTATAGEALTAGQVAYLSDGSGGTTAARWYKADADSTSSSSAAGMVGIVVGDIASAGTGTVRLIGRIAGLSGLTAGTNYYVSATAGALTATAPSNARFVGSADSTTSLVLAPNPGSSAISQPNSVVEGRLTATTAVPMTTADVSGATSIYFTPYKGNRISLYDGTAVWNLRTFTEITISLVGLTASKPYDLFAYDNAGVVTIETLIWTSATARATALTTQNGVLVKTGATTRRYLGTVYVNGSGGQTDDSAAKRYLWNYYNRVPRSLVRTESTATWTYTLAAWQQANAAAANQLDMMIGVAEVLLQAEITTTSMNSNANIGRYIAFGEDSTSTPMSAGIRANIDNATMVIPIAEPFRHHAILRHYPAVGRHFYTWLESSTATATTTWTGSPVGATQNQMGMIGTIEG